MQAFLNDPKIKTKYLARVKAHRVADEIIKGKYWENGKGCAVGCTIHSSNHAAYETELGIPEWLARVEDTVFEGVSSTYSKTWPEKFLKAIPVGANLYLVKGPFLIFVLKHSLDCLASVKYDAKKFPQVREAITQVKSAVKQMIAAHRSGDSAAYSAAYSANSAANSAYSAAYSANSTTYELYANELIRLLKAGKPSKTEKKRGLK